MMPVTMINFGDSYTVESGHSDMPRDRPKRIAMAGYCYGRTQFIPANPCGGIKYNFGYKFREYVAQKRGLKKQISKNRLSKLLKTIK